MNHITFKHTNIAPEDQLQQLVTSKLLGLDKFLKQAKNVRIEVEIDRVVGHAQGNPARIEVNLWRNDTLFRSEAVAETFEKAIEEVRNDLEDKLGRAHDKRVNVWRRTARRFKEMLRGGGR